MKVFISCLMLAALTTFAYADIIVFVDGSEIQGQLIKTGPSEVKIETRYGTMAFQLKSVKDLTFDEEMIDEESPKKYQRLIVNSDDDFKRDIYKYKLAKCLKKENPDEAIKIFESLPEQFLFRPDAIWHLANIYFIKKDFDKSLEITQQIINASTSFNKARGLFLRGKIYMSKNKLLKAVQDFQNIAENYPRSIYKTKSLVILENIRKKQEIETALQEIPCELEKIKKLKWRYENIKLYEPIIEICKDVRKKVDDIEKKIVATKFLIECYQSQAEYKKAETEISFLIVLLQEKGPGFVEEEAFSYFEKNMFYEAIPLFESVKNEDYEISEKIKSLLKCYEVTNQQENRIDLLIKILQNDAIFQKDSDMEFISESLKEVGNFCLGKRKFYTKMRRFFYDFHQKISKTNVKHKATIETTVFFKTAFTDLLGWKNRTDSGEIIRIR